MSHFFAAAQQILNSITMKDNRSKILKQLIDDVNSRNSFFNEVSDESMLQYGSLLDDSPS